MVYQARRCSGVKSQSQNSSPGPLPPKPSSMRHPCCWSVGHLFSQAFQVSSSGCPVDPGNLHVGLQISFHCHTSQGLGLCIPVALGSNHCSDLTSWAISGKYLTSLGPYFFSCKMEIISALLGLCWGVRDKACQACLSSQPLLNNVTARPFPVSPKSGGGLPTFEPNMRLLRWW